MKWINGITISLCFVVIGVKGASVVWQEIHPSLQMPLAALDLLNKSSKLFRGISFDPEDLTKLDWTNEKLEPQPVQKDRGIKVTATARTTGCAGIPQPTEGITTAQYLDFKSSFPKGIDQESILNKLDSYYCLVDASKISFPQYKDAVKNGKVVVARWLPANDLSETNVLDIYIDTDTKDAITFHLHRVK